MRYSFLLLIALMVSCVSCIQKSSSVSTGPVPIDSVSARIDSIPELFNDESFWNGYFIENPNQGGVTFCVGQRTPVVKINPFWPDEYKLLIIPHESIHELQVYRDGCDIWNALAKTNEGSILLEAEAFHKGNFIRGDSLVAMLMKYDEAIAIGEDSVRILIEDWY